MILEELSQIRKTESDLIGYLRPDSKSQVTIEYTEKNIPEKIAYTETANPLREKAPPKKPNTKSVRNSEWKLIFNEYNDSKELYNLIEDPNEENNLYGKSLPIEIELWSELKKIIQINQ